MHNEQIREQQINAAFQSVGLYLGRMISGSKSHYCETYPDNVVYFNANIVTEKDGKIWYGDLDLTKTGHLLECVASTIGEPLYVLREMDCRFENEEDPFNKQKEKAVASYMPQGTLI